MSEETIVSKYFGIYKTHFIRLVTPWVRKVKEYDKRHDYPFGVAYRQVDTAMRRYLGAEDYERFGDLLTHMALKEGLYCKDARGQMDITLQTFNQLLEGSALSAKTLSL